MLRDLRERLALWLLPPADAGSRPAAITGHVPDESHYLRCLVAESLEVYATTFVLLTENDPPRVDLAANEVQQAHRRITAALIQKDGPDFSSACPTCGHAMPVCVTCGEPFCSICTDHDDVCVAPGMDEHRESPSIQEHRP